jgi:hypothetical protein
MFRSVLVVGAVALWMASCSTVPPLANTYPTAKALANAVLEALAAGDRGRLDALALSEQEFRDHVWEELPVAQPERNVPFSYVWGDLRQKSQLTLAATLKERTGQKLTADRVTFGGETTYRSYRVHRDAIFHVRDASGARSAVHVCGSMIEKDGAWKVFSYVVDQ